MIERKKKKQQDENIMAYPIPEDGDSQGIQWWFKMRRGPDQR